MKFSLCLDAVKVTQSVGCTRLSNSPDGCETCERREPFHRVHLGGGWGGIGPPSGQPTRLVLQMTCELEQLESLRARVLRNAKGLRPPK